MRNVCSIHHLGYEGIECPYCRKERIERYAAKFCGHETVKDEVKPKQEKDREITEDDLSRLMEKFGTKKK